MGRHDVGERACMLQRSVQHAPVPAQLEALVQRNLARVLVQLAFNDEGRLAPSRLNLDHSVGQIAVLHRRNARDHLDAFDVRRRQRARRCGQCLVGFGVVVEPHAVHFDGCSERGVAFFAARSAQGHARVVRQRAVHGLSARQQRGDLAEIEHLLVVERLAVDAVRRRGGVLLALGHDRDLVESQVVFLQQDGEGLHSLLYI